MTSEWKCVIAMFALVFSGAMDADREATISAPKTHPTKADASDSDLNGFDLSGSSEWAPENVEYMQVFSIQLKVRTDDREAAETRDAIFVRLNDETEIRLAAGADGLQRGVTSTFELLPNETGGGHTICTVSDIQRLEIAKQGIDGWSFSDVEFLVNGRTMYRAHYSRGQWLDNAGGARLVHTISGQALRSATDWPK